MSTKDVPPFFVFIGYATKNAIDFPLYVDSRYPLSKHDVQVIRDSGWTLLDDKPIDRKILL